MSFIFGGLHVGSLLGLFVAPPLIERFGWPTVFYAFGLLGEYSFLTRTSRDVLAASESRLWFVSVLADTAKLLPHPCLGTGSNRPIWCIALGSFQPKVALHWSCMAELRLSVRSHYALPHFGSCLSLQSDYQQPGLSIAPSRYYLTPLHLGSPV